MILIGVDTGGTFTDFIYKDQNGWGVHKRLSTPANPAEAVLAGIRHITTDEKPQVIHGSTVATNAILEKKGAKTALVTNKRFEDIIEIGRQNRTALYDLAYRKNPPLVPGSLRYGIRCRIDNYGNVVEEMDDSDLDGLVDFIKSEKIESVAVSFLFSFKNAVHEEKVGACLAESGAAVSLSHEILSEFREFERTSTTVINAYVVPKMRKYVRFITDAVGEDRLRIMQSNGGSISAATAMKESVRTILSGPAGGAVGAHEIGKTAGFDNLITFDMGGTSTDVALIDGELPLTLESSIADYPVKVPMIDIHTVGAGGGSMAYVDAGGSLRVGPESAGAVPGPICYGKGDRITVTDANLYLGRMVPENFLGGHMALETDRLETHFREMAAGVGLSPVELAEGVLAVANTAMERAIRVISVERGFDPGTFTLFSFGGAGGMHAVFLAKLLNIPKVFIPKNPGILSAMGMVMADVVKDYSQTVMTGIESREALAGRFVPMEERGLADLGREGVSGGNIRLERYLDMRYKGQSYEIITPFVEDFRAEFDGLHKKMYGYADADKPVEIVNIRLRAVGTPEKPAFPKSENPPKEKPDNAAFLAKKDVVFNGKPFQTDIVSRERLVYGNRILGPAILVEYSSTIVMPPETSAEIDEYGNIIISIGCS